MPPIPPKLRNIALAVGCVLVLLAVFSPPFGAWRAWLRVPEMGFLWEVRRGVTVVAQSLHPGAAIQDPLHGAIQWRLLFPILGYVLSLPSWLLLALGPLGVVFTAVGTVSLLRARGGSWSEAGLLTLIAHAGGWFFAGTGWLGYYDAWVVLGLITVTFASRREFVWLACLLCPWIDERFVLAVPLALLCRYVDGRRLNRMLPRVDAIVALALVAAFVVVRLVLLPDRATNATVGGYLSWLSFSNTPALRFAWGVWEGWRVAWVLVAIGLVSVGRLSGRRTLLLVGGTALGVILVALLTAQDFSRSMMLLAPLVWLGLVGWREIVVTVSRERLLAGLAALTLLLPASQVMSESAVPVLTLRHELVALDEPPPRLAPAAYELRGVLDMERGNPAQAELALTLAIKLDAKPTSALKHRGLLYAGAQRWNEALKDFRAWSQNAPQDPDAWFLVAQAEGALGNSAQARAELQRALNVAPKGWSSRPDVGRFASRLGVSP